MSLGHPARFNLNSQRSLAIHQRVLTYLFIEKLLVLRIFTLQFMKFDAERSRKDAKRYESKLSETLHCDQIGWNTLYVPHGSKSS